MLTGPNTLKSILYADATQARIGACVRPNASGTNAAQVRINVYIGDKLAASASGAANTSGCSNYPLTLYPDALASAPNIEYIDLNDPTGSGWSEVKSGSIIVSGGTISVPEPDVYLLKLTTTGSGSFRVIAYNREGNTTELDFTLSGTAYVFLATVGQLGYSNNVNTSVNYVLYRKADAAYNIAQFVMEVLDSSGAVLTRQRTPQPLVVVARLQSSAAEEFVAVMI